MTSVLKVDTIQSSGGTTGLTIDSNGRPLIPNGKVPCFHVYRSNNQTISNSTQTTLIYNANFFLHDWTLDTSTGILTAGSAAAGIYALTSRARISTSADGDTNLKMHLNGSGNAESIESMYQRAEYYDQMTCTTLYEISAGDNLRCSTYHNTGSDRTTGNFDSGYHTHFFGYRISA